MKKLFLSWFALTLALFTPAANAQQGMKIVVFGDNMTSGYQLQENEAYAGKLYYRLRDIGYEAVSVVGMSETGRTTSSALQSIDKVLMQRPDIVILQLGFNDVIRGANTDIVYNNIVDIAGKLQQRGIFVILFGISAPDTADPVYTRQLQAVYQKIADFYRTPFYPDILQGIRGNQEFMLADSKHPNGKGIDIMVENTFRMVDAGLRWKWDRINEQRGFDPQNKVALPPAMPPMAEPEPLPPR